MDKEELEEKTGKEDLNNGLFRNPKKLIEEMNEVLHNMSPMKREFCHAMQTAESGKAAAIVAGYAPNSAAVKASNLLTEPAIQRYIGLLGLLRAQATALDAREVVSMQLSLYYRCLDEGDIKEANKALDQLAKMTGMYNAKVDPRINPNPKEIGKAGSEEKENITENMIDLLQTVQTRDAVQ